ncbi:hypothetical protein PG993_003872 [Apiospora rasikravindrae]|uniref:Uncharacterized protein n=1 Tax=Apiospora rasikravindrae TaxID=990691 RepID=A0ABR1U0S9_9PEZI
MQFMFGSALLAGLVGLGSAAPVINSTSNETVLISRDARAYCAYQFHLMFPKVGVYVPNNLMGSAQGTGPYGPAELNWCNPRAWQAQLDDAGTGLICTFNTYIGCHGDDVARAPARGLGRLGHLRQRPGSECRPNPRGGGRGSRLACGIFAEEEAVSGTGSI